jgi:hypothetical protein
MVIECQILLFTSFVFANLTLLEMSACAILNFSCNTWENEEFPKHVVNVLQWLQNVLAHTVHE